MGLPPSEHVGFPEISSSGEVPVPFFFIASRSAERLEVMNRLSVSDNRRDREAAHPGHVEHPSDHRQNRCHPVRFLIAMVVPKETGATNAGLSAGKPPVPIKVHHI